MSSLNSENDCLLIEPDISVISVADSPNKRNASAIEIEDSLDGNNAFALEEGEVFDVDSKSPTMQPLEEEIATQQIEEPQPVFEVNFLKKSNFKNLGHIIINALREALNTTEEIYTFKISDDNEDSVILRAFEGTQMGNGTEQVVSDTGAAKSRESTPDYGDDLKALFSIDTEPTAELNAELVPSYKRTIKTALDNNSKSKKPKHDENKCERPRASQSCFNCGSNEHGIRDCNKPRNLNRINRAKKAFGSKQERYHVDVEQRFAHLRPGNISNNLKVALGVGRGELPFFIYRMRILGYPPGWLEDAKVEHSGIALYNADGADELKTDDVDCLNHKYNASKIIDFPGYNINPGKNFYDDYKHHNVPPMQHSHLKEEFIKSLGSKIIKGYKRRKLQDLPTTDVEQKNNVTQLDVTDMEIENELSTIENVIFTRPPPPPPDATTSSNKIPPPPPSLNSATNKRSLSPSLADLEAQHQELLSKLEADTSRVSEQDDSLIDEVIVLDESNGPLDESNGPLKIETRTQTTPTPLPKSSDIEETHMGTPLLKFSPFDRLPAGENFKIGVSDVINFENLPDSTGKYEQMKLVITRVRNIVTKLHKE